MGFFHLPGQRYQQEMMLRCFTAGIAQCLYISSQIKQALQIGAVQTGVSSWVFAGKKEVFRMRSKSNKTIHLTMITTYGIAGNDYKMQLVDSEVRMEDLFR